MSPDRKSPAMRETSTVKLTYEDLQAFPDDGRRHEIIDGEHSVTPAPNTRHQAVSMNLSVALKVFLDARGLGLVLAAPTDVLLSELDVVQPDVLVVLTKRLDRVRATHVEGAPDIVAEIVSSTSRRADEIVKRKLYERFGAGEYWIVDPDLETVKVYRRSEQGFTKAHELSAASSDALTTPLLPGLEIRLAELFA